MFKNYKLEEWNIGLQQGLINYNPDFYDTQRDPEKQEELLYNNMLNDDIMSEYNISALPNDDDNYNIENEEYSSYAGDEYD